jgi:hypothetical protein
MKNDLNDQMKIKWTPRNKGRWHEESIEMSKKKFKEKKFDN